MATEITAGLAFVKSVITLYRTATYYREKEILARKFMDYSLEAGRFAEEVITCPDSEKSVNARKAYDELGKAMFILKVMCGDGIYAERRVKPVKECEEQLKSFLDYHLTQPVEEVPVEQPEPAPLPIPEQPAALPAPVAEEEKPAEEPAPEEQPAEEEKPAEAPAEEVQPAEAQEETPAPKKKKRGKPREDKNGFYEIYTGEL